MAVTNKFVDFLNGLDANTGDSDAQAYKTIQRAVDQITDGTEAQQINIKSNTVHVLVSTINWTLFTPTNSPDNPLMIRGYTIVANDDGVGEIDGNNAVASIFSAAGHPSWVIYIDLKMHNTTADVLDLPTFSSLLRCEIFNGGVLQTVDLLAGDSRAVGCFIHTGTSGAQGIGTGLDCRVIACFVHQHDDVAVQFGNGRGVCLGNLIKSGGHDGVRLFSLDSIVFGNTIIGDGTDSTSGIFIDNSADRLIVLNNIIAGWSGTSSTGLDFDNGGHIQLEGHNLYNDNTVDRGKDPLIIGLDLTANDKTLDPLFINPAGNDYSIGAIAKEGGYPLSLFGSTTSTFLDIGVSQRREGPSGLVMGE